MLTLLLVGCIAFLEDAAVEAEREASLTAMRERAGITAVSIETSRPVVAKIRDTPVFRYSDEERGIQDATLWVFEDRGRPVAMQKVEHYPKYPPDRHWLYCVSSLVPETITADWRSERTFRSKAPGVVWKPLLDAPKPASTAAARLTQLRQAARRFSATIVKHVASETTEMRLITTPLHRYSSTEHGITDGALFGLTATGTNPDAFVAIEVDSQKEWRYGVGRMTLEGLSVKLDRQEIWTCEHLNRGATFDTWLYFHTK